MVHINASDPLDITIESLIADGTSSTGWKRKTGITPKDYLFPHFVMTDWNYCN